MTDCPGLDCMHTPSDRAPLSEDGIHLLVDRFYAKVRQDEELGPIFENAIAEDA